MLFLLEKECLTENESLAKQCQNLWKTAPGITLRV